MQTVFVCARVLLSGCGRVSPATPSAPTAEPAATFIPTPTIQGTRISFETIDRAIETENYSEDSEKNPFMIILSGTDDTGDLNRLVPEKAMGRLRDIDFDRELVIAVFQGWKPSTGYEIQVQWVIRTNGEVVVVADLINSRTPDSIRSYLPGNPLCTPVISAILSGGALPVAGIINQSKQGTNQWTNYPAIAFPGQMIVIPVWYRDSSFTTGIVVMNVSGSQQVKITVRFFASTGGSEIEADRKAVNHVRSGAPSDGIMSHSGVHR